MDTTDPEALDRTDMARLVKGDGTALNALLERHATPVFHFLCRLLGNEDDANDLAQETFVRVYRARDSYRPAQRFATWLFTIAANLARNQLRWRARHPQVPLSALSDGPIGVTDVAERATLPKSTAARLLSSLAHEGFVEQVPGGTHYRLGPRILTLAASIRPTRSLVALARPQLAVLADAAGEAAGLSIPDGFLVHSVKSCNSFSVGQLLLMRTVEEKTGRPGGFIESDLVDPRYFSASNLKNRIESYLQMIEQRRQGAAPGAA